MPLVEPQALVLVRRFETPFPCCCILRGFPPPLPFLTTPLAFSFSRLRPVHFFLLEESFDMLRLAEEPLDNRRSRQGISSSDVLLPFPLPFFLSFPFYPEPFLLLKSSGRS